MNPAPPTVGPPSPPRLGLAIASLVLGIMAFLFSLFVVGALFGIVGLVLGCIHITAKRGGNTMAWWGVSLSILGIIAGISLGVVYFKLAREFYKSMASISSAGQASAEADWQGVLAPEFSVTTLDGRTIRLGDLKGKRVVVDFWATWCGPCVKEIPHLVKLYNETSREQLEIVGISDESEATLRPFVKQKDLPYPIVSAKDLPSPYKNHQAIPTTFFIDRKGVIQSVAAGYQEFDQLKSLALAEDYPGEAKSKPESPASGLKEREKMLTPVEVWSNSVPGGQAICTGDWDGDGRPDILVADAGKQLHVFGADGVKKTSISLPGQFAAIDCGRDKQKGARLLGYERWGRKVIAMDAKGQEIWHYSAMFGADGAHWGDLDGDGTDEMIIGMNGLGGLHALAADGKRLWQAGGANVWGQAVVPATKDRAAIVLATDASGSVRILDGKGNPVRTVRPGGKYCTQLAAAAIDGKAAVQALALGQDSILAFDPSGRVAWSTSVSQNAASWVNVVFASGDVDGDGASEWAFVDSAGDLVLVSAAGEKLAAIPGFSGASGFVIVSDVNGRGQLITLSSGALRAFSFQER